MSNPPPRDLTCPVCAGSTFRREHTRLAGKLVRSRFKATMMVCDACSHAMFFEGWHEQARRDDGARL